MPSAAIAHPAARGARLRLPAARIPALLAWALGFALVAYLAFSDGGYDTIVRNQVGIAVWWLVLVGALAAVLPGRIPAIGWVAIGLLTAFLAWTAISTGWSESAERSWGEAGRIATYLGFLLLGLAAQRRAAARQTLNGVACAIGLVGVLALLSRLHPAGFPANEQGTFLGNTSRLAYPLNYWNALAALMAIGVPLLLAVAATARRVAFGAAAAGLVPVLALAAWFTESRGGVISFCVAVAVWLALSHDRLARLATVLAAGAGSAILLVAADHRAVLSSDLHSASARAAGDRFIWIVVVVCVGVALLHAAIALAGRHAARPRWLEPRPVQWLGGATVVLLVAIGIAVAAGAPGKVSHAWNDFKAPPGTVSDVGGGTPFARLQSTTGHGRYQYWQVAADAQAAHPWEGIGAGTFEFWWSRHATTDGFVRNAHSLYMETFGELGIPGLALIAAFVLTLLGAGVARALRAPPELRVVLAGATAAIAAWAVTAAYEWIWQLAAMVAVLMLLGAAALAGRDELDVAAERAGGLRAVGRRRARRDNRLPAWSGRAVAVVLALGALPLIAIPLAGATNLRSSQRAAAAGMTGSALHDARGAQRVQGYAATPHLQQALLFEQNGALPAALVQARQATRDEPTNWRTWLVRARIEAENGQTAAAVRAFDRFKRLNPKSTLLALK